MLALRSLRCAYPHGPTLAFPDFELAAGQNGLLHGPSGSGKSTLLALIAGLLTPLAGDVVVGGRAVGRLPPRERDAWRAGHLGFVPQRLHLSASLDVADNVALPYVAVGEAVDRVRVAGLLERLGVAALAARRPHELSVGQAQRVALARAMVRRPALLLADEPTASLDDGQAAVAVALLAEAAAADGSTLLVATHDARVGAALPAAVHWRLDALK
jgi:putative ABC transport system ATP-binding protein